MRVQQGYSQATVAATVDSGYQGLDRKLKEIAARARKHLGSNPALQNVVWVALERAIVSQLQQLEQDLQACFPDVGVPMRATQVAQLLKGTAP